MLSVNLIASLALLVHWQACIATPPSTNVDAHSNLKTWVVEGAHVLADGAGMAIVDDGTPGVSAKTHMISKGRTNSLPTALNTTLGEALRRAKEGRKKYGLMVKQQPNRWRNGKWTPLRGDRSAKLKANAIANKIMNRARCTKKSDAHNRLFFTHKNDRHPEDLSEPFLYYIETPWKLSYPKQLQKSLERMGFEMRDAPAECLYWHPMWEMTHDGVKRGRLMAKWPDVNSALLISSYNDYWEMIEDAMEDTFPSLEIAMIILGSFGIAAIMGFTCRWLCKRCGWVIKVKEFWQRKRNMRAVRSDCVELAEAKKQCTCQTSDEMF